MAVLATVLAVVLLARWWWWRAPAPSLTPAGATVPGVRLDLNTAAWFELDALPGVGETLARRIVEDRERRGPFATVDDLARVPGISTVSVSRWRPFLTIAGADTPARD